MYNYVIDLKYQNFVAFEGTLDNLHVNYNILTLLVDDSAFLFRLSSHIMMWKHIKGIKDPRYLAQDEHEMVLFNIVSQNDSLRLQSHLLWRK